VIRGSLDRPETFIVDTAAIVAAKAPDFKLQPRDIVYVNARPWVKIEELLDLAGQAFIEAAVTSWTGGNVGPVINRPITPDL
jgi:polysaccharide biosynthesis/export protein